MTAVQATTAGEHGRGFSVVADEMSRLATSTATATETIAETIDSVT